MTKAHELARCQSKVGQKDGGYMHTHTGIVDGIRPNGPDGLDRLFKRFRYLVVPFKIMMLIKALDRLFVAILLFSQPYNMKGLAQCIDCRRITTVHGMAGFKKLVDHE